MRMDQMRTRLGIATAMILGLGMGARTASAGLSLTVEPPGAQRTSVSGVTTEDFDGFTTGWRPSLTTAVGTISGDNLRILAADQYGGEGGGGNYLAVGGNGPVTLDFGSPQAYFGFWWSAADPSNAFEIYSGSTLLGRFDPATALEALSYEYKGNPNDEFLGWNYGEKYAYLNFFGTEGTTFDRVVFMNPNSGSLLELDSFSIRATAVPEIPGEVIPGVGAVPEPSSFAMAGASVLAAAALAARRRSHRAG
ncbi:Npun_F0296 family exosortase-dependent surface protein [Paludisphaera soli]|uniref:Npun_F0296 family exosortase-dependent surface protein n=1 Tax=Paludisphaera soli TaxID=2712865 RepID=UPI0013EA45CE|nr:PEP-CTERM sorting domain-containing protein [Paludisphaera soli]